MKNDNFTPALGYRLLSSFYDQTVRWTMPEREFRKTLVEQVSLMKQDVVLDFGYGTGSQTILLKQRCPDATILGLDIDPEIRLLALAKLKASGLKVELDLYNGTIFPYSNKSIDKVVSSLVFHQLSKQNKLHCLREIFRVLKAGGQLHIGDWGKANNVLMRLAFLPVQLLDGFNTMQDNVKGRMPYFIEKVGFVKVREMSFINTKLGTYSFYKAMKPHG